MLHTPLVLHGASTVIPEFVDKCNQYGGEIPGARGVPEDMITEAVKHGVCKVNIDTDLRLAMTAEVRKFLVENPGEFDPRKYLGPARAAIKDMVKHKIKDVLNASGSPCNFTVMIVKFHTHYINRRTATTPFKIIRSVNKSFNSRTYNRPATHDARFQSNIYFRIKQSFSIYFLCRI